jgi:hypothetical protein
MSTPPPVTAQDAVNMIRYQRELVAALETERASNLCSRAFDEAKTTVEFANGILRISFPIYPQMLQMSDYEEENSDAG